MFHLSLLKDFRVLYNLCFKSHKKDGTHQEFLESLYGGQAEDYDQFRENFLWGRRQLMLQCSKKLYSLDRKLTWVDLGGGTGENVKMMFEYLDPENFEKVYIVDLCESLTEIARLKSKNLGWENVEIVCTDACRFKLDNDIKADLVTFSYSLTMIPLFHQVIDNAFSMMKKGSLLGVTDFYISDKVDSLERQMTWYSRMFWRTFFDFDNINVGPERRAYLDYKLEKLFEENCSGTIPYLPFLKAPYYVWIGQFNQ